MSWQIFKQNILRVMNEPESISDIDIVAKTFAAEYDAAIKRGGDTINLVALKTGNIPIMEQLFKVALQKGLSSTQPYDLVGEMGQGVLSYWAGATLNEFPIPAIPAIGSVQNIGVISNIVTNSGVWTPAKITPPDLSFVELYNKLDFNEISLDKNSEEVQNIINPNVDKINQQILSDTDVGSDIEMGSARVSQLNNVVAEILDEALIKQKIVVVDEEKVDTALKSGYKNLDELLKKAGALAPKLGKSPKVTYVNLKTGYVKGIHGLCPQGTQAVVAALTGIVELGKISGHADWFSFKENPTGGGRSSFAKSIGGKVYYNDKVKVNEAFLTDATKWQVGDVIAQGYTVNQYGHIQVWTGFKWLSDFTQSKVQKNNVDFTTLALWRLNDLGKEAVRLQKG